MKPTTDQLTEYKDAASDWARERLADAAKSLEDRTRAEVSGLRGAIEFDEQ